MSNQAQRHICVILVDRANYGRLKPVMQAILAHPDLRLSVLCAGTMVLSRFDQPVKAVRDDGFTVVGEIYMELEGSNPTTMAKSVGFGVVEFASELARICPDFVLLIGDRYEALSATIAAAFMNIPVIHMQGGEVSGSIDESTRHAITRYAHYHFPATQRSAEYLLRMGERPESILGVGCPSSDLARTLDLTLTGDLINVRGSGIDIAPEQPYLLAVFHPTTTEYGDERTQMESLLAALDRVGQQTLLMWPNIDAGSDQISKTIRVFRDRMAEPWLRTLTNLSPENYLRVLCNAACAVGNSSSFVRDASFFGTPVVLVGNRQNGRERSEHVTHVPAESVAIERAIRAQLGHGRYAASDLYGDGHVAERIARAIATLKPYRQKSLSYVDSEPQYAEVPLAAPALRSAKG